MAEALNVWLHSQLVGRLEQGDDGGLSFTYASEWLAQRPRWGLSQSLPPRAESYGSTECRPYFSGLLPEEEPRRIIADALHVSEDNDFGLLQRLGGECAGAVTLLPPQTPPAAHAGQYTALSQDDLAKLIEQLPERPLLAGVSGVRLSLAGVQSKLAIRLDDGGYLLPLDGSPTTHILKPPIPHFANTVHNEAFCMRLASRLGLSAANIEVRTIGNNPCLVVARYDRTLHGGEIRRLHQEDFCQALGVRFKYEQEGGPSLNACFELVRRCTKPPINSILRLFDAVVFNYLIANNDAHAKNFSLLYQQNSPELAPLYDLLCTGVYDNLSGEMAMRLGTAWLPGLVKTTDWELFARDCGLASPAAHDRALRLAEESVASARALMRELAAAGEGAPILVRICDLIEHRAKLIERALRA